MRPRLLERTLWSLGIGLGVAGGLNTAPHEAVGTPEASSAEHSSGPVPSDDSLVFWRGRIVQRDPFRIERRPAALRFGETPTPPAPLDTRRPQPDLQLAGILGGPPWRAVIEGLPGTSGGTMVREGDVIGAFTVRSVGRDSVVIAGADTTWTLKLKETWR